MTTSMHFGATKQIFQYAELLRKNMTVAERIIWEKLCKNQLGVKFRRQQPVWKFIADFYCHELNLIIEIDGGIHLISENKECDINREETLRELGMEIIRFTNDQVINETDKVIEEIKRAIELLKQKSALQLNKNTTVG